MGNEVEKKELLDESGKIRNAIIGAYEDSAVSYNIKKAGNPSIEESYAKNYTEDILSHFNLLKRVGYIDIQKEILFENHGIKIDYEDLAYEFASDYLKHHFKNQEERFGMIPKHKVETYDKIIKRINKRIVIENNIEKIIQESIDIISNAKEDAHVRLAKSSKKLDEAIGLKKYLANQL